MKKYVKILIIYTVCMVITCIVFSMVNGSFEPWRWSETYRGVFAYVAVIGLFFGLLANAMGDSLNL